jgi:DNA modification methylase
MEYRDFVKNKAVQVQDFGFEIQKEDLHPSLYPHQQDTVLWALKGGRRAIFSSFGLGKTRTAIEICRQVLAHEGGKALIVAPLGVRQEFTKNDGPAMGVDIQYIRTNEEADLARTNFLITNYERIRDGQVDPSKFQVVCLDEASVLRSTGSLTFDQFMKVFQGVKYRFVFTATPSPNRYLELINYAHFLGVMDRGQALTRFFKRDSQKAGNLKEKEFWFWVCSWSLLIYRPSDLGHSDEGYKLPELKVIWHEIPADHTAVWGKTDKYGNAYLLKHEAMGLEQAAAEKRASAPARLQKVRDLVGADDTSHWLIWHHLEYERELLEKAIPESTSVYGSLDLETREDRIIGFSNGEIRILNTKPELSGSGCNFQRHCHRNIFFGIDYGFNDFIQAVHRTYRFLQTQEVEVHIIYTETERAIAQELKNKWSRHEEMQAKMREITSVHGLHQMSMVKALQRASTVERHETKGKNFTMVNNDCVEECRLMEDNSVGLVVTSIPFSNHYEYTPSYLDFGHTDDDDHFFAQMDYLIPELLRVLQPGRCAAIHVKDRIFYGSQTGEGFSTVNPFHMKTTFAFMQHGFQYMGKAVIPTDVVAENNQTYRLAYGRMVKDGTVMGFGSHEYLLLFRKPQTDKSRAWADIPVTKDKNEYGLGRWQIDADALWRSSGDRLVDLDQLVRLADSDKGLGVVKRKIKEFFNQSGYDYKTHVQIAETLNEKGRLPKVFSLMQPPVSEEQGNCIWDDVLRMRTLNMNQALRKKEQHVCPLQIDIIERAIERWSNKGDLVFDPFGGIGSVPYVAVKMGRQGYASELNKDYYNNAVHYLRTAEYDISIPTLFDYLEEVG